MCVVCDEFGSIGCPSCEFCGTEVDEEREEIECKTCQGNGYFYFDAQEQKHIDGKAYEGLSIYRKRDVEVYACDDCNATGIIFHRK